jgi:leucyl-tRNA synthetase
VAKKFPAWQDPIVELVRANFDELKISVDFKSVTSKIDKKEMKRAMPFAQGLTKRLQSGEKPDQVFERQLSFDEVETLKEMIQHHTIPIPKLSEVVLVSVDEGGKTGTVVFPDGQKGDQKEGLPPQAESALPGQPSFAFENI